MRLLLQTVAAVVALAGPASAGAQHSHGGSGAGMSPMPRHEEEGRHRPAPAALPAGVLPVGSPRQIEVLVVSYGFSPEEIRADQGEEVILYLRRIDDVHCKQGLAIPARDVLVQLPIGETVPVTLKLDRAEKLDVECANEGLRTSIIVSPR